MNRRLLRTTAFLVAAVPALAAIAQQVEHGRGKIESIDVNNLTVQLRDPQGRVATRSFAKDATVKFTDGAGFFRNPSIYDLRAPMYVHYTFSNDVIDSVDVVELGFDPATADSSTTGASARKEQGVARTVTGRVYAYDPAVRQVAVEHGGTRETFQLTSRSDAQLKAGDRVELRTEWSGQRELVTDLRVLSAGRRSDGSSLPSSDGSGSTAEGRVVRISQRGVLMDVAGTQQTYGVANSRLLRRLRVGDTVRFSWEDRKGRLFITSVE